MTLSRRSLLGGAAASGLALGTSMGTGALHDAVAAASRQGSLPHRTDVVVVGTRGLGALGRTLQGSVSEHVATHAKATVVVAR